jgi:hypothetical protein
VNTAEQATVVFCQKTKTSAFTLDQCYPFVLRQRKAALLLEATSGQAGPMEQIAGACRFVCNLLLDQRDFVA